MLTQYNFSQIIVILLAFLPMSICTGNSSPKQEMPLTREWNLKTVNIPELDSEENIKFVLDFMEHVGKFTKKESKQFEKQINAERNLPKSEKYFQCPPKLANEKNLNFSEMNYPSVGLYVKYIFPDIMKTEHEEFSLQEEIRIKASMEFYRVEAGKLLIWAQMVDPKNALKEDSNYARMENELKEFDKMEDTNIVIKYEKFCKIHNFSHRILDELDKMTGEENEGEEKHGSTEESQPKDIEKMHLILLLLQNVRPSEDCENLENAKELFEQFEAFIDVQQLIGIYFGEMIEKSEKLRYLLCHQDTLAYKRLILHLTDAYTLMKLEQKYPEILRIEKINADVHFHCYEKYLTTISSKNPEALEAKYYLMTSLIYKRIVVYEKIKTFQKDTKTNSLEEHLLVDVDMSLMRHKLKLLKKLIFTNPSEELSTPRTFCRIYKFITIFVSRIRLRNLLSYPIRRTHPSHQALFEWNGSECDVDESELLAEPFWEEARAVLTSDHQLFLNFGPEEMKKVIDLEGSRTRMEEFIPGFNTKEEFAFFRPNKLFSNDFYLTDLVLFEIEVDPNRDDFSADWNLYLEKRRIAFDYYAWHRHMEKLFKKYNSNKFAKNFVKFWKKKYLQFVIKCDEIYVKESVDELAEYEEKLAKINAGLKYLLESNLLANLKSKIFDVPSIELIYQNLCEDNYVNWNKELKKNANKIEHFHMELEEENTQWIRESLGKYADFNNKMIEALKTESGPINLEYLIGLKGANQILTDLQLKTLSEEVSGSNNTNDKKELDEYFGKNDQIGSNHPQKGQEMNSKGNRSGKNKKKKGRNGKAKRKGGKAVEKHEEKEQTSEESGDEERAEHASLSSFAEGKETTMSEELENSEKVEEEKGSWTRVQRKHRKMAVAKDDAEIYIDSSKMHSFRPPLLRPKNTFVKRHFPKANFGQYYEKALSQWQPKITAFAMSSMTPNIITAQNEPSPDKPIIWQASLPQKLHDELDKHGPYLEEIKELKKKIDQIFEENHEIREKDRELADYQKKWTIERKTLLENGENLKELKMKLEGFLKELKFIVEKYNAEKSDDQGKTDDNHNEAYESEEQNSSRENDENEHEIGENSEEKTSGEFYFGSIPADFSLQGMIKNASKMGDKGGNVQEGHNNNVQTSTNELEKSGQSQGHKIGAEQEKHVLDHDLEEILHTINDLFGQFTLNQQAIAHSLVAQRRAVQYAIHMLGNIIRYNWIKNFIKYFLITGSYLFNGHSSQSDIDGIVLFPYVPITVDNRDIDNLFETLFFGANSKCDYTNRKCGEIGTELSLFCALCHTGAQSLRKIRGHIRLIKFHFLNVQFKLTFVPVPHLTVHGIGNLRHRVVVDQLIQNYFIYHGTGIMDSYRDIRQGMLLTLSGYRASLRINEVLIFSQKKQMFRLVMLTLKLWAKNHFIYSSQFGFFNGTMLAVMACQVITEKENQGAPFLRILHLFFKKYSKWSGINPKIYLKEKLRIYGRFRFKLMRSVDWQPESERGQRHLHFKIHNYPWLSEFGKLSWVVLSPGFPRQNAAFNVNLATAELMGRELKNGLKEFEGFLRQLKPQETLEFIKNGFKNWITKSERFEEKYGHFFVIGCLFGPNAGENGPAFCEYVESRIRLQLLFSLGQIGQEEQLLFHANPEKVANGQERCANSKYGQMFIENGEEDWHCVIWLVGIEKRNPKEKQINSDPDTIKDLEKAKVHFEAKIFNDFKDKLQKEEEEKFSERNLKLVTFVKIREELANLQEH